MKYIFMIVAIFLVSFEPTLSVHAENRIIIEKGLYGVADTATGEYVIKPSYEELSRIKVGYIAKKSRLYGIINKGGEVIVKIMYNSISEHGSYYIVSKKYDKYVNISRGSGKYIQNVPEYQYGVMSSTGEILIPIDYNYIGFIFTPGIFKVRKGTDEKKCGLINIKNEILLPIEYDIRNIKEVSSDKILVTVQKGYKEETIYIDIQKEQGIYKFKKGDLYGFKNDDGQEITEPIFDDAFDFNSGYARVKKDGKWGFIDEKGKLLFSPRYNYCWDFNGGKAKVRLDDGSIRYVDTTGKETEN